MFNISDKICRVNQITHYDSPRLQKNPAFYVIMWRSLVKPDRPQMTIWCMRVACWLTKATGTHSEYVIVIAFPWL